MGELVFITPLIVVYCYTLEKTLYNFLKSNGSYMFPPFIGEWEWELLKSIHLGIEPTMFELEYHCTSELMLPRKEPICIITKLIISLKVSGYQTWGFTSYSIDNGNQHSVIEFSFKTYVMYSGSSIYKSYDIDVRRE